MKLKEALLSFKGVIDNEYLDRYVELVNSPFSFEDQDYTEEHHVIPVSFYQGKRNTELSYHMYKRTVAEADPHNSLVRLSFKNHCLAHWLLCQCTMEKLKHSMCIAFLKMTSFKVKLTDQLPATDLVRLQQSRNELMEADAFYWKPHEDQWLRENRTNYTLKECAEFLHKPYGVIATRCHKLGLTKKQPTRAPWTEDEITYLKANYPNTPITELTKVLSNRTPDAIGIKARSLGLTKELKGIGITGTGYKLKSQIENQKQWLIDNYITVYNIPTCRSMLGLSRSRLCTIVRDLGIHTRSRKPSINIKCLETSEVFNSKEFAVKITGISTFLINKSITTGCCVSSTTNTKYTDVHFQELA